MKPTTSAVLSDKIALSEGDHPDTSLSDLDASKKVLPSTKALIVASAEGVVLSHEDKSSEMKPASPGSSLPPDMALSAEETTAATMLALDGSDVSKAEDSKVDKTSQGESFPGESFPGESVLEVDTSSSCPCPQSLLHLVCILSDSGQDVHEEVAMASDAAALATSAEPAVLSSPPSGGSVSVADVSKENPATLDPPPSSRVSESQEVSEEAEETAGSTSAVLVAEDVSGEGPSGESLSGETDNNGRVHLQKQRLVGRAI